MDDVIDALAPLRSHVGSTSTMIKYYYEGGTRVAMRKGSTNLYYLLTDHLGSHFEWAGSTSTMIKYYYESGTRVAMREGGSTLYYLLTDHLGSTAITASSSGGLYSELRYRAWGEYRYISGDMV